MGYEVVISRCELSQGGLAAEAKIHRKLKYGNLDLDTDVWKTDGNKIVPVECLFKWDDRFVEDLTKMAKVGAAGFVETVGELGEHTKYVLKAGKVEEYCGETVYPEKPCEVYG